MADKHEGKETETLHSAAIRDMAIRAIDGADRTRSPCEEVELDGMLVLTRVARQGRGHLPYVSFFHTWAPCKAGSRWQTQINRVRVREYGTRMY